MADFPSYKPTYSISKTSEPKIRRTQFGDGYMHRISFGLNQNPKQYDLNFNVKDTDADVIEAFLDARAADGASFTWIPPEGGSALKFICPQWKREFIGPNRSELSMTFQQVFEP